MAARQCAEEVQQMGMRKVEIWVKGPGSGREAAIRSLKSSGLEIARIKDVTAVPHNGTRQPRRRR
jgi:small subunit ribosomal protein S11